MSDIFMCGVTINRFRWSSRGRLQLLSESWKRVEVTDRTVMNQPHIINITVFMSLMKMWVNTFHLIYYILYFNRTSSEWKCSWTESDALRRYFINEKDTFIICKRSDSRIGILWDITGTDHIRIRTRTQPRPTPTSHKQ